MRALLTLVFLLSFPSVAVAQARWNSQWEPYGVTDAVVTSGFAALAITTEIFGGPRKPRWDREILADLPIRRALGAESARGESTAATLSDVGVVVMMTAPLVDAGVAGYAVHRDITLATNFGLVALESFAVTFGVTNITKVLVGRARPPVAECFARRLHDPDARCAGRPNVSFYSGHSAAAFTGAGLVCAFGTIVPMHGEGAVGQIPCVSALAVATTTAVLRIIANKHHSSDVIFGSAMGLLSGWLLPRLRFPADP